MFHIKRCLKISQNSQENTASNRSLTLSQVTLLKQFPIFFIDVLLKGMLNLKKFNSDINVFSFYNNLGVLRSKLFKKLITADLNIKFLRNEFETLVEITWGNVDILLITETKLDESFPTDQFKIKGLTATFRLNCDISDGGIMFYR